MEKQKSSQPQTGNNKTDRKKVVVVLTNPLSALQLLLIATSLTLVLDLVLLPFLQVEKRPLISIGLAMALLTVLTNQAFVLSYKLLSYLEGRLKRSIPVPVTVVSILIVFLSLLLVSKLYSYSLSNSSVTQASSLKTMITEPSTYDNSWDAIDQTDSPAEETGWGSIGQKILELESGGKR